jgi:DNA-binding beta-propeller fold protein YncE
VAAVAAFALAVTAAITGAPAALAGTRTPGTTLVHGYPAMRVAPGSNLDRSLNLADAGRLARAGFGSALVGSAPVGNGPSAVALDAATHTIYVANGSNPSGPNAGGNTVSVIDARHCNAQDVSRCKGPWPTITVGDLPSSIAVDHATNTVYVTIDGDNTVAVFDGATCNALDTSGCGQAPAHVRVGPGPYGIFADDANHTVYVANPGTGNSDTMSMINTLTCNASNLAGCPATRPPTVDVGAAPVGVTVDQATHTVYVTTFGTHRAQNGSAVFDADTCNAAVRSGCGTIGRLIGDPNGPGPTPAGVDPANDSLYMANFGNTVSVFDLRHCHAGDLAGCASQKPGTVTPLPFVGFDSGIWVAVDVPLHSVYVSFQKDDALIVVDTNVCNGSHQAACAALRPPTIHTGSDPEGMVLDGQTQTLYTADEVDNTVSVIGAARCNAADTRGCRHPAPAVAIPGPGASAADPAVHTTYVTTGANAVAMINTRACNAHHRAGCTHTPAQATVGTFPADITADPGTHTVYVANFGSGNSGTVSVLDTRTCNATHTTGCAHQSTLKIPGGHPDALAVNAATGTLYVATITAGGPNLISVFNAATCNATTTTGCGQAPAMLRAGDSAGGASALSLAVNPVTNTLYATNVITNTVPFGGNSVYVFNGATCDAADTTGCGQAPATVNAGFNPWGIAVNPATDTIYTANIADGEHPGTASVINGATCNGTNHTGCGQAPATVQAGFGAVGIAIDPAAGMVYVTNTEDTSVSVINGNTCNGTDHTRCGQIAAKAAVGNYPGAIATDPATGTAYISNADNTVSVIPLAHPMH